MSILGDAPHLLDSRILVVDDDPWAIKLAEAALREFADVRSASSAADALRMIEAGQPDLILLDAQMPGEGGLQFCRRLKSDPALRHISIIFVTAQSELQFELEALEAGASDFIGKPYSFARMQLRIRLHLQLKWQIDQLHELAATDPLTNLANRRAFEQALRKEAARALRAGRPLSLILFDVDHFKLYNDTYGHVRGDECLRAVAGVAADVAQRTTDLAARYGGEEFAILLPEVSASGAQRVAERLQAALREAAIPHQASPTSPIVTVSIGVASMSGENDTGTERRPDPEALTRTADDALYEAKRLGRNRVETRNL